MDLGDALLAFLIGGIVGGVAVGAFCTVGGI